MQAIRTARDRGLGAFETDRVANARYPDELFFERQAYLNLADVGSSSPRRRFDRLSDWTAEFMAAYPEQNGARVTITAGGRSKTATANAPSGDPERPLSRATLCTKFDELVVSSLAKSEHLAARLLSIETESDLTFLESLWMDL